MCASAEGWAGLNVKEKNKKRMGKKKRETMQTKPSSSTAAGDEKEEVAIAEMCCSEFADKLRDETAAAVVDGKQIDGHNHNH